MRKLTVGFFMVLCCAGFLASGCAKKEMVQKDVPIPPAAVVKPPETVPVTPPPVKEEAVRQQTVTEAPATVKTEPVQDDKTAALQRALERIYFDFDSFVLTATSRDSLSKNAALLAKNNPVKVQIEGHCDERGSDEYNLALGEKRAKAALSYLVTLGISPERLSIISYGKEKPLDMGHDESGWAKNRRAEFVVIK